MNFQFVQMLFTGASQGYPQIFIDLNFCEKMSLYFAAFYFQHIEKKCDLF